MNIIPINNIGGVIPLLNNKIKNIETNITNIQNSLGTLSHLDYNTISTFQQSKLIGLLDNGNPVYPHFVAKIDDMNNAPIRCFFASSIDPLNAPIQLPDNAYWIGWTMPIDNNQYYLMQEVHLWTSNALRKTDITYIRYKDASTGWGNWINTTPIKFTVVRYLGDITIPSDGYIRLSQYFTIPENAVDCSVSNFGSSTKAFGICFESPSNNWIYGEPGTIIKSSLSVRFYIQ